MQKIFLFLTINFVIFATYTMEHPKTKIAKKSDHKKQRQFGKSSLILASNLQELPNRENLNIQDYSTYNWVGPYVRVPGYDWYGRPVNKRKETVSKNTTLIKYDTLIALIYVYAHTSPKRALEFLYTYINQI